MKQPELSPQILVESNIQEFVSGALDDAAQHMMMLQDTTLEKLHETGRPMSQTKECPIDEDTSRRYNIEMGTFIDPDNPLLPMMHYTLTQTDYQVTTLGQLSPYDRQCMFAAIIDSERENYFADNFIDQLRADEIDELFSDVPFQTELSTEYRCDEKMQAIFKEVSASSYYADILISTFSMTPATTTVTSGDPSIEALAPNDKLADTVGVRDVALMSDILYRFGLPGGRSQSG